MAVKQRKTSRSAAVKELKRHLILEAARKVFEAEGLDGASLRAIALEAGYTPAALYFHFDSKEAIYAEVLQTSLKSLETAVREAVEHTRTPSERLRTAALSFFTFYANNPRDLDLGFYLFRGGMKPRGLGRQRDEELNLALERTLQPLAEAATAMGATNKDAKLLMVDVFAHATGLLLLAHTGRIKMFGASAQQLMERYIDERLERLKKS